MASTNLGSGIRAAPSLRAVDELVREHIVPTLWPDTELAALRRRYTAQEPGSDGLMALYSLDFEQSGKPTYVTLRFGDRAELGELFEQYYAGQLEAFPSPAPLLLTEYGCLVEPFPYDWKMPGLARAAHPEEMREFLRSIGFATSEAGPEIETLRYRPGKRCVVAYGVRPGGGTEISVIGKVLAR